MSPGQDAASGNDAGSTNDATTGDGAAATTTIPTLRNPAAAGRPGLGTKVTIQGVIVTGVKTSGATHGFFVQDPSAKEWAGIYVYAAQTPVTVAAGAIVTVSGVVAAFRGLEQIDVTQGSYTATGSANVPAPLDVTPSDIRAGSATADKYQSMVLRVKSVTAKTATSGVDFIVTSINGSDDLIITSYVANDSAASEFPATIGQTYTSIVGRGYKSGPSDQTAVAKLAPMNKSEVTTP